MGKDFNPPSAKGDPSGPCFDPECMDKVAGLINGCAEAIHSGSLAGADTSTFPVGGLIFNADGMGMMEVWSGVCPVPLPYADGFVGMIVTLPDGTQVKAVSRDDESCKLSWELIAPSDNLDCDAVIDCLLGASPEQVQALCELLGDLTMTEVPAAPVEKKGK